MSIVYCWKYWFEY